MLTLKNFDYFAVNLVSGHPAVHMTVVVTYEVFLVIPNAVYEVQVMMTSHLA